VALARALVNDPSILLADEPTGSLDVENEDRLLELFRSQAAVGKAILVATHSEKVAELADRVVRIEQGALA
jgi:putative ABC transport system ATP-binding protein